MMVVRLVKMHFTPEGASRFMALFPEWQPGIAAMPGCHQVELLRDAHTPEVFFTRSLWGSEEALEAYRRSATFAHIWPQVKKLFAQPAQAWSLHAQPPPTLPEHG